MEVAASSSTTKRRAGGLHLEAALAPHFKNLNRPPTQQPQLSGKSPGPYRSSPGGPLLGPSDPAARSGAGAARPPPSLRRLVPRPGSSRRRRSRTAALHVGPAHRAGRHSNSDASFRPPVSAGALLESRYRATGEPVSRYRRAGIALQESRCRATGEPVSARLSGRAPLPNSDSDSGDGAGRRI